MKKGEKNKSINSDAIQTIKDEPKVDEKKINKLHKFISSPYTKIISAIFLVITFLYGIKTAWDIHNESLEKSKSVINYAFTISPVTSPFSTLEKSGRWIVSIMINNQGPATANSLIFHLFLRKSDNLNHSSPIMTSKPATAAVDIIPRSSPDYFQIVFKNFAPSDAAFFEIPFEASEENINNLYSEWKNSMFSKEFFKYFINSFELAGENIVPNNMGIIEAKTMKESLEEIIN